MRLLILTLLFTGCFFSRRAAPPPVIEEPVTDSFPEVEQTPAVTEPILPPIKPVESGIVRWPRDQDLAFTIAYCSDVRLQLQWRQVCGTYDSEWYDMREKGMVDPLDADYLVKTSSKMFAAECMDTVVVMIHKMRDFPKSNCEWSFRARLLSKRNIYDWVTLGERIVLADPGEFESINPPKIELIKPLEKNTP